MPYLEREGARIFYEDTGGDGPAVLFSHGILMDHTMFDPQVRALAGRYRCIRWDERGHGETESSGSFSYWDLADDAVGLLDDLGVQRAIFVGMSQGGFISLRAALKHAERVAGLFLIDTQAGPENPEVLPYYESLATEWATKGPSIDLARPVADIILGPADPDPWIEKWMRKPPHYVIEPFNCLAGREDITDRLPEIGAPCARRPRGEGRGHRPGSRRGVVRRATRVRGPVAFALRGARREPQPSP